MHEWQQWMYKNAYVVPTTGTYSITAVLDGRLNLQLMFGMKLVLARINKPTL